MRILILMGGYWPGHEATGPNQSLRQMCHAMKDTHEFLVLARDRPFGGQAPLAPSGRWIDHGFAQVRYATVLASGPQNLRQILKLTQYDVLWMNGFHDREFTLPALAMRRLGLVPSMPAILSPRGELSVGALGLKPGRKAGYRPIARTVGLLRDVWLHAASAEEAQDIEIRYPWSLGVLTAPNVRGLVNAPQVLQQREGAPLRIVVVGRIARVKNIAFAIECLAKVSVPAVLDIVGPVEEPDYWRECEALIRRLPAHVSVKVSGVIANLEVPEYIGSADVFFSPTLGENFGHAIFEALSSAVPVLISDRTPWKGLLAKSAGWELPLGDPQQFADRIDRLAKMTLEKRLSLRTGARRLAEQFVANSDAVAATERMLQAVARCRTVTRAA